MNKKIFKAFISLWALFLVALYLFPAYLFISSKLIKFKKEVYLGGDNIVLDYATKSDSLAAAAGDNYATIATITYISEDGFYGAVGHGLDRNDFASGNIYVVPVASVIRSSETRVGEKNVNLGSWQKDGTIKTFKRTGVYGEYTSEFKNKIKLEVGMPSEIEIAGATLYTNIDGTEIKAYEVEIVKLYYARNVQNIYLKITDSELIKKTGGVIQGMSGSPIVQNGKLIGALSHVDDKNPLYGYGLFITYML